MLVPGQLIKVSSHSKKKKEWIELGYKEEDGFFYVRPEHLSPGSHARVLKRCDHCGAEAYVSYKDYLRHHDDVFGDTCQKCETVKAINTWQNKYNVDNPTKIEGFESKRKRTMIQRHGVEYPMQSPKIVEKSKKAMKEKYGVEHALQNEAIMERAMATRNKHKCFASHPQKKMGHRLLDVFHNCLLEELCGRYSLDCVVNVDGTLVDVEYDGWYYHQDRIVEDAERNDYVIAHGYKVLRVIGNKSNSVPTAKELEDTIKKLVDDPDSHLAYIDTRKEEQT